jgi:hypothetical protein
MFFVGRAGKCVYVIARRSNGKIQAGFTVYLLSFITYFNLQYIADNCRSSLSGVLEGGRKSFCLIENGKIQGHVEDMP